MALNADLSPGGARSRTPGWSIAGGAVILVLVLGATYALDQRRRTPDLVLLTEADCTDAVAMRERLDAALARLGLPATYAVVDIATLPASDARRGYGSPTVLYRNEDVFGLPKPRIPVPQLTCRVYPGGVPSTDAITTRIALARERRAGERRERDERGVGEQGRTARSGASAVVTGLR